MDFFARQDQARRHTKLLVAYFAAAVVCIIAAIYFVGLLLLGATAQHQHRYDYNSTTQQMVLWNPRLLLRVTVGTLAVIACGMAYKTSALAGGGSVVAASLGGRLVNSNTTNLDERRLLNVVEEMAIAAGVPMPQVFVLDEERGINAFAAGHTTSDAAVAVTRGCLTLLKRDELQGVIGHEFSHILNGDMKLNVRLLGILFGILCIATIGRILLHVRSGNSRDRNPLPLLGLALLVIGGIGVLFGRLIQAAVSRQREFLADASAVQFTRNPPGLSGALQKIGRYSYGSRLESEHASDAAHLFFGNGVGEPFFGLLATHPPIDERIRALDPVWDGKFPPLEKSQAELIEHAALADLKASRSPVPDVLNQFGTILGGAVIAESTAKRPPVIRSSSVLPNLGSPTPLHLKFAEQWRDALPDTVKAAVREPLDAVALIYAMLLDGDEKLRAIQLVELAQRGPAAVQAKAAALYPEIVALVLHVRLPLVNITLPALRQLRPLEFTQFSDTLKWLIESDQKVELFEFVLQKIIQRHLASQFSTTRRAVVQYYSIKPLLQDCGVLLSALAHVGSSNGDQNRAAFEKGAPYLRAPDGDVEFVPMAECGLDKIDAALDRLDQAAPQIKKNLLEACVQVVGADGVIQEAEAELLRAVADTLDCPIPPFVPLE